MVIIDTIRKGAFSIAIDRPEGRIRCGFNPMSEIQDVLDFIEKNSPGYDCTEIVSQIADIWTQDVVEEFRQNWAEQEALEENNRLELLAQEEKRLELTYAEEQAYIENAVRELLKI